MSSKTKTQRHPDPKTMTAKAPGLRAKTLGPGAKALGPGAKARGKMAARERTPGLPGAPKAMATADELSMRHFVVEMDVEILIDDRLLRDVLTDDWRSSFYALHAPEDVAEHLAFNLVQGRRLESLDGFADQAPTRAIPGDDWITVSNVTELKRPEVQLEAATRQIVADVKDAIHARSDGQMTHASAIMALDEIIRYAKELRSSYVESRRKKASRSSSARSR